MYCNECPLSSICSDYEDSKECVDFVGVIGMCLDVVNGKKKGNHDTVSEIKPIVSASGKPITDVTFVEFSR